MENLFALVVLLSWIPASAAVFFMLPLARAFSVCYVAGWLLLPFVSYDLPGMPNFGKATVILLGSALGLCLHKDSSRIWGSFRLSWIDAPALLLCASAIATSLVNGLGLWDGVSASFGVLCIWAGPYLLARLVFRSLNDIQELVKAIFLGGVCYVPLCLIEIRLSPQLHSWCYGFYPRGWGGIRFGGYRPSVFMECGLELGLWMSAACLVGFILCYQGRLKLPAGVPASMLLAALMVTTVLCRSTGALVILILGLGTWMLSRQLRSSLPMTVLVLSTVAYVVIRSTDMYDGAGVVEFTEKYVAADRAESLDVRLKNEDLLGKKAWQQPWFGWGGWGRSRVYNEDGADISLTDGRWIIIYGVYGLIGLAASYSVLLVPCLAAIRRYGSQLCQTAALAPVAALVLVVTAFAIDTLLNDFPNPIYLVSAGAVGSVSLLARQASYSEGSSLAPAIPRWSRERRRWPPSSPRRSVNS